MPDNFGERAATEDEIEDWIALVRAGRAGSRTMKVRAETDRRRDSMRPTYGSGQASYEGED